MARWRGLWHLPSLCVGGVRGRRARRPSEQQANSPRSQQSHSCQRAARVQGPPPAAPGGASAAPLAPSSAPPRPPSGTLRNSHWEAPTLPLGVPVGASQGPSATCASPSGKSQWEKIKSHWEGETGRVGVAKRASKSEWERRGGPRRVPLGPPTGRRATTVRATLHLGYLPIERAKRIARKSITRITP